jgi:predicted O-methyltransferase YrrM
MRRVEWPRRVARQSRLLRVAGPQVWQLWRAGTPQTRRLSGALLRGALGRVRPDERAWVRRIESERRRLYRSDALVAWKGGDLAPVGMIARGGSQPQTGCVLLLAVVRAFAPRQGLEMGTCVGVSAAYQAAAMRLAGHGELVTLEGYGDLVEHAREVWTRIGLDNVTARVGRFDQTLPQVLKGDPIDYAYLDGNHQRAATVEYFERISDAAAPGALLIFDDIDWSPGMSQAWEQICQHPQVAQHARTGRLGIVVLAG